MLGKIRAIFLITLIALQGSCGNFAPQNPVPNSKAKLESTIRWLNAQPDEPIIYKYKKVKDFLANHKVYVSLTTSPKRIRYLMHVIRTLNLEHVEKIIINIPERFGRDQSTYSVPDSLREHPKVVVNVLPKDLGPITKLVPGVEYVRALHQGDPYLDNFLVITVDDDTGYPWGMINNIIKTMVLDNGVGVVASSAPGLRNPDWHIEQVERWPMPSDEQIVEGFGGIGYRVGAVDTELMRNIINREAELKDGKNCYLSDDMVISYSLAMHSVARSKVNNRFYNLTQVRQYSYGMEEDALHRGAGDKDLASESQNQNANDLKYHRCYDKFLVRYFPAPAFLEQQTPSVLPAE